MSLTNFPNGISSFGVPILGGAPLPATTGKYFFVSSDTGLAGNSGADPTVPLATVDQAINKCVASRGDVIIVMPGHTETIASATTMVPDIAGVSIIGLGEGGDAPTFTFSATASTISITGEGTLMRNLRFHAGISAVVNALTCGANHVWIDGCVFYYGGTTGYDFARSINIDALDDCKVTRCKIYAENATAGAVSGIRLDDAHRTQIIGCEIYGDFSTAAIVGEGAASLSVLIKDNLIYNDDTASAVNGINFAVANTGLIVGNLITGLYATDPDTLIDPGSCGCLENYVSNAIDESGTIVPTAIST